MGLKKNMSCYFIGSIISKTIAFLLVPIYISSMTTAEYGIVGSMIVIINVLSLIITLGVERSIYRLYHDYNSDIEKKEFLGSINFFIYAFASITILLLFVFKEPISHIYKSIPFSPYFVITFFVAYSSIFGVVPMIYLQVSEKAGKFLIISIIQTIVNAIWILYFTVFKHGEAKGMLMGLLCGNLTMIPLFLWFHLKEFACVFKIKYIKSTLIFSLPLLPALISSWVINMSSQVFIENNFSTSEVAIYSLSLKLVAVISLIFNAIFTAYCPIFYKEANSVDQDRSKKYLINLQNIVILFSTTCTSLVAIFAKDILQLIFPQDYHSGADVVAILTCGTIIFQLSGFLNLAYYQNKKTGIIMWISISSAVLTILLNVILIPRFSLLGAAFTYLFSSFIVFLLTLVLSKKIDHVPYKWKYIFPLLIMLVIAFIINRFFLPVNWLASSLKAVFCCILAFCFFIKFRKYFFNTN